MTEIHVWKWEYTDESGKRKVSRWLMTEKEAIRYKDAIRLHHTLRVTYDAKSTPHSALPPAAPGMPHMRSPA
jgi:hypothetical protein